MSEGYINHTRKFEESEINTDAYRNLKKQLEEFESFYSNKKNENNIKFSKDNEDKEYTKWLKERSFASGLITPQDYQEINMKYEPSAEVHVRTNLEFYQSITKIFQNFVYLGTKRHSTS